jgi:hypothetical protein
VFGKEYMTDRISLTAHDFPHILGKPIDNLKGLCCGHANFFIGQPIQSLKNFLNVSISNQLLSKLLCSRLVQRRESYL